MQQQYLYQAPTQQSPGFGESPTSVGHWAVPLGRSWQSIASGYIALFSVLVWPLGPVAVGLGIWALRVASRQGSHGRGRAVFAIGLGTLTTLLLLVGLASIMAG